MGILEEEAKEGTLEEVGMEAMEEVAAATMVDILVRLWMLSLRTNNA